MQLLLSFWCFASCVVLRACLMSWAALSRVRYMNTFTYSRIKRTQVLSGGSRIKDGMRQFMASLTVEAFDLKVLKPQADELAGLLANAAAGGGGGAVGQGVWGASGLMPEQPQAAGVGYGAAKVRAVRKG